MTLDQFLRINKVSERAFSEAIGVSQPHVHRFRTGESWPNRDVMIRIREATQGQVSSEDFLPPPKKRRA